MPTNYPPLNDATSEDYYRALAHAVRDRLLNSWLANYSDLIFREYCEDIWHTSIGTAEVAEYSQANTLLQVNH